MRPYLRSLRPELRICSLREYAPIGTLGFSSYATGCCAGKPLYCTFKCAPIPISRALHDVCDRTPIAGSNGLNSPCDPISAPPLLEALSHELREFVGEIVPLQARDTCGFVKCEIESVVPCHPVLETTQALLSTWPLELKRSGLKDIRDYDPDRRGRLGLFSWVSSIHNLATSLGLPMRGGFPE